MIDLLFGRVAWMMIGLPRTVGVRSAVEYPVYAPLYYSNVLRIGGATRKGGSVRCALGSIYRRTICYGICQPSITDDWIEYIDIIGASRKRNDLNRHQSPSRATG
jgi:hypothetical protein